MKKLFVLMLVVSAKLSVKAQYVSLTNAEVKTLQKAIRDDDRVKKTFEPFKTAAEKALADAPNPIEKVRSEGLLEGNPAKTASAKAVMDCFKIYALAINYRVYNDKQYLNKAGEYLMAWAKLNQPTDDPIDGTKMDDMIAGYDLIRSAMPANQVKQIDAWFDVLADEHMNSKYAKDGRITGMNNWNSHRIKVIAMVAYTIHTKKYDQFIFDELEKQIAQNLYADGSGFDFKQRDALHYHIYTLEPLFKAIIPIYRATGKNYYTFVSKSQSSIEKSVQFLVPFITGEKTHGEFANSTVQFDRDRAKNGEKGYAAGTKFVPATGIIVLSLADYFDHSYLDIIKKVKGNDYYDWQLVLNQVRKKL
ncbi:alginate lyase family protein [Mucilaginibacter sp.]|uniref:alginate lyase family protein n=1 Tax=Mucilaginibacter sp. TaxID=1882438 RepID=UPI0026283DC9|nr:alginate lyase family protein [Mucilaginibacter sp.]MDB4925061.1 Alginate lyase [Mucilaginibacter sp.]